jgi:hypothetical protein
VVIGGDVTNVQWKSNQNHHDKSAPSLNNEYILKKFIKQNKAKQKNLGPYSLLVKN